MKIADIRERSTGDLHGELDRTRRHLFDLRAQSVTEKLESPTQLGATRKDIARILTVLRERGEQNIEEKQHHLETLAVRRGQKKK
jgi:large subunit ribosomal protein L29